LAVIFGLGVVGVVFGAPIVALVIAVRARRVVRSVQTELTGARFQLERAEKQLVKLAQQVRQLSQGRLDSLDAATSTSVAPVQSPPEPAATIAIEAQPHWADSAVADPNTAISQANLDAERKPATSAPAVTQADAARITSVKEDRTPEPDVEVNRPPPAGFDWEGLIGVRLFAWLGGGALFLGAALFLHYSIQQNLISPPVRVALGLIAGALLLASGDRVRVKTNLAGQAMAGAGIGTLYASLYAGRTLYHIVPTAAAFAGMILITVTAGILSVRRGAYLIAVLGLVGGMATPFMLSTGEDHTWTLFAYVALLDAGVVIVVRHRNWPTLALIGMFLSLLVFVGWSSQYLYPHRTAYALAAVATISGIFATLLWQKKPTDITKPSGFDSAIGQIAVAVPLLMALLFTRLPNLRVEPWFLVTYLTIIAAGAWLSSSRLQSSYLPPITAIVCVLTLLSRCDNDLFPARSWQTLACFTALPVAHLLGWLFSREASLSRSLRLSLIICLSGPLLIGSAALGIQAPHSPVLPIAIFTAVHVAGLILLAIAEIEARLVAFAQGVALAVLISATSQFGLPLLPGLAVWIAGSGLLFWALPLILVRLQAGRLGWYSSALSLPLHYVLIYGLAHGHWGSGPLGSVSALGGVLTLLALKRARGALLQRLSDRLALSALYGAICLAFLTASLPILLENQWLTLALALEVPALAWLRKKVEHSGLVLAAAVLAGSVLVRLLLNPSLWDYQARTAVPILNIYLYTFGVSAIAFLAAARWLQGEPNAKRYHLTPLLNWSAIVLLFVLLNIEVADAYSVGKTVIFRLSGGGLAEDMTYSLMWGLFALVLLVLGIVRHNKALRIGALLVLVGTIAKVFLHDLWQLGALYRVGSIVGLAVALLAVSYLIQRFILRGEV
jgi:uncharacterized membrane protein